MTRTAGPRPLDARVRLCFEWQPLHQAPLRSTQRLSMLALQSLFRVRKIGNWILVADLGQGVPLLSIFQRQLSQFDNCTRAESLDCELNVSEEHRHGGGRKCPYEKFGFK